jgi:hypothetical protein
LEGQSQISGDTILIFIPPQADKYNTKVYPPSLWQATSSGLRQYFQIHFTPKIRQTKAKTSCLKFCCLAGGVEVKERLT